MKVFKYQGVNRDGKKTSGELEANDQREVKKVLRRQGIRVTEIKAPSIFEIDIGTVLAEKAGGKAFGNKDLARFTKQFSTLIEAGVPILQSLEILYKQEKIPGLKKSIKKLATAVSDGKSLFDALSSDQSFDRLYCQLIKAGEVAGILDTILVKLAEFLEKKEGLKKKIKSAMTYPTIVVIVGIGVISGLLAFVVPQFVDMIKESGQEIPWITQFVMDLSDFFQNNIVYLMVGGLAIFFGMTYAIKNPTGKKKFDQFILKVPLFGKVVIKGGLSSFSQTLSTLLSSGIPIVEALEICSETMDNAVMAKDLRSVRAAVMAGKNITEPLKRISYFPELIAQMIEVGENTGTLDEMLMKVAKVFEIEVEGAIQGLTQLIEPLILVVLGGSIGAVMVAMYLPIFMAAGG
jgi:type IV pilus assembly protein PilC